MRKKATRKPDTSIATCRDVPKDIVVTDGTDGKVTMVLNGKGRRFHWSRIDEMKEQGWTLA